jgi:hypothetical protein
MRVRRITSLPISLAEIRSTHLCADEAREPGIEHNEGCMGDLHCFWFTPMAYDQTTGSRESAVFYQNRG